MTLEQFRQLFLAASEVPAGMRRTQDSRRDPQAPGEAVWMAREGRVWRLVDRRTVGGSLPAAAGQVVESGPGFRVEEGPEGSLVAHFESGGVAGTLEAYPEEGGKLAAADLLPLLERARQRAGGVSAAAARPAPPAPTLPGVGPAPTLPGVGPAPTLPGGGPAPTEFSPEPAPPEPARPEPMRPEPARPEPSRPDREPLVWARPPEPSPPRPIRPEDNPPDWLEPEKQRARARSKTGLLAAGLLVAFLLVGLVAAGAGYLWWSHRPFCGEPTPPPDPRMAACKERLAAFGQKLQKRKDKLGTYPSSGDEDWDDFAKPLCPITGDAYRYYLNEEGTTAILFCGGWGHAQANRVAYDFKAGQAVENGLEPPKGTWLHYRWAIDAGTPELWSASIQDLAGGWSDDAAYLGELKADALNNLDRFQEALDLLKSTQPGLELSEGAEYTWMTALRGVGRYEEALRSAEKQDASTEGLLFLMGNTERLMPLAHQDEGVIPDWFLSLVPFAQRDYATAFKESQRYLESAGYSRSGSTALVMIGVASGLGLKTAEGEQKAKEMLRRALHEDQRDPLTFPTLQVANNELTVEEAVEGMTPGAETSLRSWIGCLREVQGRQTEARALYEWVRDKGSKYEVTHRLAVQRL